jgi:hypothetical protein
MVSRDNPQGSCRGNAVTAGKVPWNKGLSRPVGVPVPWNDRDEKALVESLAGGLSYCAIARALGRAEKSVQRHAEQLGLKSRHQNRIDAKAHWTKAKQDQLKDMVARGCMWSEITAAMDRSEANCRIWAKRLGAVMPRDPTKQATNGKPWTKEDDALLMGLACQGVKHQEIAERLGRTRKATFARMGMLNHGGQWRARQYNERAPRAQPPKRRKCLGPNCRGKREFMSTGPENRICQGCRETLNGLHMGHV